MLSPFDRSAKELEELLGSPEREETIHDIERSMHHYLIESRPVIEAKARKTAVQFADRVLERIKGDSQSPPLRPVLMNLLDHYPYTKSIYMQANQEEQDFFAYACYFFGLPQYGKKRDSGNPSLMHALETQNGIASLEGDPSHIISAYSHDFLEDIMGMLSSMHRQQEVDPRVRDIMLNQILSTQVGDRISRNVMSAENYLKAVQDLATLTQQAFRDHLPRHLQEKDHWQHETEKIYSIIKAMTIRGTYIEDLKNTLVLGSNKEVMEKANANKQMDNASNIKETAVFWEKKDFDHLVRTYAKAAWIINLGMVYFDRAKTQRREKSHTHVLWNAWHGNVATTYFSLKKALEIMESQFPNPSYGRVKQLIADYTRKGGMRIVTKRHDRSRDWGDTAIFNGTMDELSGLVNKAGDARTGEIRNMLHDRNRYWDRTEYVFNAFTALKEKLLFHFGSNDYALYSKRLFVKKE